MSQNTQKEKWSDLIMAVIGMVLIFACLSILPKAWEKEEAFKMERQDAFLADAANEHKKVSGEVK